MKNLIDYIYEGQINGLGESQYEDEIPLTPVKIYNDESTSMLNEPVYGKDIDKLVKYVNSTGDVSYSCKDSKKSVEEESGLDKDEFEKSAWAAVVDPESYDNEVIIVSVDDITFTKEDEKIYGKYRSK